MDSRRSDDPAWKKLAADYPGTQDTEASYRQWMSESDKPTAEEIADTIEAWGEAEQWTTERGRYIPKMSNWIRNRGWLDKPARRETESLHIPSESSSTGPRIACTSRMTCQTKKKRKRETPNISSDEDFRDAGRRRDALDKRETGRSNLPARPEGGNLSRRVN